MSKKEYVTVKFLSEYLSLSEPSIWNAVRNGSLPAPYRLGKGSTRWRLSEVDQQISSNNSKMRAPK